MFFKLCKGTTKPQIITLANLSKTAQIHASEIMEKTASGERIKLDPTRNFYLQNWAVSALEKWGWNDNFDAFEREELGKSYKTFVGSWMCLDHQNWSQHLAVGENIDAVYMPEDYVQIVMAGDRKKVEARSPGLEARIARGEVTDTSMGCWCRESVCGNCGNVAFDETQYCDHIANHRGEKVVEAGIEKVNFEKNRGVVFFEDSVITDSEGADRNAKILAKVATHHMVGPKSIPADKLYFVIKDLLKQSSREEKAFMSVLLDRVTSIIEGQ